MKHIIRLYIKEYFSLNNKCILYLFLHILFSIAAGIFFFIAIYLKLNLKLDVRSIANISSFFVLGQLLGSWLSSKLLDQINYFYLTSIALLIVALSLFLLCVIHQPSLLIPTVIILGVGCYLYIISSSFLITNLAGTTAQDRGRAISLLSVSSNMGIGIGGTLVNYFSIQYSQIMFALIGILLLIASLIYWIDGKIKFEANLNISDNYQNANKALYRLSLFFIFMLGIIFAQQRISYALFLNNSFGAFGASSIFLLNSLIIIFCLPISQKRL